MRMLILSRTIQEVTLNVCTEFQNPRCSSSCEILNAYLHMHYIGVRDGKIEKRKKEGKISFSNMVFFYTIFFNPLLVSIEFEESGSLKEAGKSVAKVIGEKK